MQRWLLVEPSFFVLQIQKYYWFFFLFLPVGAGFIDLSPPPVFGSSSSLVKSGVVSLISASANSAVFSTEFIVLLLAAVVILPARFIELYICGTLTDKKLVTNRDCTLGCFVTCILDQANARSEKYGT